jgi:hypothetical protein
MKYALVGFEWASRGLTDEAGSKIDQTLRASLRSSMCRRYSLDVAGCRPRLNQLRKSSSSARPLPATLASHAVSSSRETALRSMPSLDESSQVEHRALQNR